MADQKKAPADGVYTLNGGSFRIRAGKVLPEGAEFRAADAPENKAKAAPSNKSRTVAIESKAKAEQE